MTIMNRTFFDSLKNGMKDSSDYLSITKVKFGNYVNAGLVPDLDVLYTFDTDELPFDIRYLSAKLNSAVYGTSIIHIPDSPFGRQKK